MVSLSFSSEAIQANTDRLLKTCSSQGLELMAVTKAVCGFPPILKLLVESGLKAIGDSNPENLTSPTLNNVLKALLKSPPSQLKTGGPEAWDYAVISHSDVGQGSGGLLIMIELGDGKDGVAPQDAADFAAVIQRSSGRPIIGAACNFGCLLGRRPDSEALRAFEGACRTLRSQCGEGFSLFSAGGTIILDALEAGICRCINQVRIGEGLLLGYDSSKASAMDGYRQDTVLLRAEILELREKELPLLVNPARDAYGRLAPPPPQGRHLRAVLDAGSLAAPMQGLSPLLPGISIEGQTFDFLVLSLEGQARDLKPGDTVSFAPSYGALSQACLNPYVRKSLE